MFVRRKHIGMLVQQLLTNQAVKDVPVDVVAIAKKMGLEVRKERAEPDISGFLLRDPKTGFAVIGVNSVQHANRQRFTVAHELGHFLLHRGDKLHVDRGYEVKLRDIKSSEGTDLEEKEANLFAAELLMPEQFLAKDLLSLGSIDLFDEIQLGKLAKRYKVSTQALAFRLAYLGYS